MFFLYYLARRIVLHVFKRKKTVNSDKKTEIQTVFLLPLCQQITAKWFHYCYAIIHLDIMPNFPFSFFLLFLNFFKGRGKLKFIAKLFLAKLFQLQDIMEAKFLGTY